MRKKIKIVILILTSTFLSVGCGVKIPVTRIIENESDFRVENHMMKNYSLNKNLTVGVGDVMISVRPYTTSFTKGYKLLKDYSAPYIGGVDRICCLYADMVFIPKYKTPLGILIHNYQYRSTYYGYQPPVDETFIEINEDGEVIRGTIVEQNGNFNFHSQDVWTKEKLFEKGIHEKNIFGDYSIELVYSGKIDENIKVNYYEYQHTSKGKLIRDSFSKELQYNLNEGNIISYKTIKLEIIKATNNQIEFKVISDQDVDWLKNLK